MAIALDAPSGCSAHVWLGIQDAYDLWHTQKRLDLGGLHRLHSLWSSRQNYPPSCSE